MLTKEEILASKANLSRGAAGDAEYPVHDHGIEALDKIADLEAQIVKATKKPKAEKAEKKEKPDKKGFLRRGGSEKGKK